MVVRLLKNPDPLGRIGTRRFSAAMPEQWLNETFRIRQGVREPTDRDR